MVGLGMHPMPDFIRRFTGFDLVEACTKLEWPNEIEISDFEGVWQRSTPMEHGLRLIEKIDLIVTKQLTDRAIDRTDVAYLSERVTEEYEGRLINCSEEQATELFARFD